MLKIAIVSYYDNKGGAGKAAYRLFRSFQKQGFEVKMFVFKKITDDPNVVVVYNRFNELWNHRLRKLTNVFYSSNSIFSLAVLSNKYLIKEIKDFNPDIVNLHWVNNGMLSVRDLLRFKKPIFWSLHDIFPITGGCHYSNGCKKYVSHCSKCPILKSRFILDLSWFQYKFKKRVFEKANISFIGLSSWITEVASSSMLTNSNKVFNVPNVLDLDVYKPLPGKRFFSNQQRFKIMFSAMGGTENHRKGFDLLLEALRFLPTELYELTIVADKSPSSLENLRFEVELLPPTFSDTEMVKYLNKVDLMIVPSREENLSNVIFESIASGTPVVAFDIGGNGDLIKHKINGFLVPEMKANSLAEGIEWMRENTAELSLSGQSRKYVEEYLNEDIIISSYQKVFENG